MGSSGSVLNDNGYTLVSEANMMMLVKNKYDDLFAIKKLKNAYKEHVSDFLQKLSHPHIVHYEEIITDSDCLYLVLEHCEGGNLAQKIQLKKEQNIPFYEIMTESQGDQTMEYNQILDWTVKICMALKHLHDQQILHKNLQPKSIFFTACGTIRLGEFGQINKWSSDTQTTQTEDFFNSYIAPEILNSKVYDEKSEIWSLGCIIYEMCMLKCAFSDRSTMAIMLKILKGSYEALPVTFPADLRELVKDTLQVDPGCRPSVNQILTRPFVIKHLYKKSKQTIEELKVRKHKNSESRLKPDIQRNPKVSLKVLDELADSLESVHYNTTVGSLAGGVVGLAGGITSIVGVILAPFTLGASLIVTGVGIGVGAAGGVTAGASNVTKMVNQRSNRQNMKMIIRGLQEKISSTIFCIQTIQIAINQHKTSKSNKSRSSSWSNDWENSGPQPGLGGILKLMSLLQGAILGLYILVVTVNVFLIALDAKEIHKLRQDYASIEAQRNSPTNKELKLQSEIMKFVKKIRETADELEKILEELKNELMKT